MTTKNISIALVLIGSLLYANSGDLFSIAPFGARVFAYKIGHVALAAGFLAAIYYAASSLVATLRERLRDDTNKVVESNNAVKSVISAFATEYAATMQDANDTAAAARDLTECQAHVAAGTALSADARARIPDLLTSLGKIAHSGLREAHVTIADELHSQIARLQVTLNGVTGPALLSKAESFLAVHQTACDKFAALKTARTRLTEAENEHVAALAALNGFAA